MKEVNRKRVAFFRQSEEKSGNSEASGHVRQVCEFLGRWRGEVHDLGGGDMLSYHNLLDADICAHQVQGTHEKEQHDLLQLHQSRRAGSRFHVWARRRLLDCI